MINKPTKKVQELIDFYNRKDLPKSVNISPHGTVNDVKKFAETHLLFITKHSGNPRYLPYYNRLVLVKSTIEKTFDKKILAI